MAARRGYRCVSCCVVICRPLGSGPWLHRREVKIGVVSVRARGAAQTMTHGYGVTVLGLVGGAPGHRVLAQAQASYAAGSPVPGLGASMSTLAQLVFPPELSAFSQQAQRWRRCVRHHNQRADVDSAFDALRRRRCELICSCSQSQAESGKRSVTRATLRAHVTKDQHWLPSYQWPSPPARA